MNTKTILIVLIIAIALVAVFLIFGNNIIPFPSSNSDQDSNKTSPTTATSGIIKTATSTLGTYLTDVRGRTLYTSSADRPGESVCDDKCVVNWPPYSHQKTTNISSLAGDLYRPLSFIKRQTGTEQYAYNNKPLYYYSGDTKLGDTKGNGLNNGQWSVVLIK